MTTQPLNTQSLAHLIKEFYEYRLKNYDTARRLGFRTFHEPTLLDFAAWLESQNTKEKP